MSFAKQVAGTFEKDVQGTKDKDYNYGAHYRQRVLKERNAGSSVMRLEGPSNLPRAHSLGYKAKQGIFVVLVRVSRGAGLFRRPTGGRRPKMMGMRKLTRGISKQVIAEKRAGKKFPNCEVLNSYWIGKDGKHYFYEVILVDRASPSVLSDSSLKWIAEGVHRHRAERGKTSA